MMVLCENNNTHRCCMKGFQNSETKVVFIEEKKHDEAVFCRESGGLPL